MATQILIGDATERLRSLADCSVHCCVTSPPYFGLRDYGVAGQIGLETRVEDYVAKLVMVFREVRRVLRDDGTLWLNLGDSYANSQLIGGPWRVAFALQSDGWFLRQDVIWAKPNPMPESVRNRCTKAHEYLFLLSKNAKYYFDNEAIKVPSTDPESLRGRKMRTVNKAVVNDPVRHRTRMGFTEAGGPVGKVYPMKNRRSVWTIAPAQTRRGQVKHFATFPPALIEPCIKASTPPGGIVLDPFGGSGTTAQVAESLGRNAILIELNEAYRPLIEARLRGVGC